SWLDLRTFASDDESAEGLAAWIEPFFLKNARVALNNGLLFGDGGHGFARLNFATPRSVLVEALERMYGAVQRFQATAGK
ncbi:MAG: cystathionine beta-lyase, partial [Phototrophicaceae bacterium]